MTYRPSGRAPDEMRTVKFSRHYTIHAEGSVLVEFGNTKVLCNATIEDRVPGFLKGKGEGWITAEYGMLPRSTNSRMRREASQGRQGGRTLEIQRLIGRSLRAVVDRRALGERTATIDCDVIQADGGTRTTAITGSYVALHRAFERCLNLGFTKNIPLINQVASISCGLYKGTAIIDLDYDEDANAEVDANFVLTENGGIVEIQSAAEADPFSEDQFFDLLKLAQAGVAKLAAAQRRALAKD